jgi:hypothetical protein
MQRVGGATNAFFAGEIVSLPGRKTPLTMAKIRCFEKILGIA